MISSLPFEPGLVKDYKVVFESQIDEEELDKLSSKLLDIYQSNYDPSAALLSYFRLMCMAVIAEDSEKIHNIQYRSIYNRVRYPNEDSINTEILIQITHEPVCQKIIKDLLKDNTQLEEISFSEWYNLFENYLELIDKEEIKRFYPVEDKWENGTQLVPSGNITATMSVIQKRSTTLYIPQAKRQKPGISFLKLRQIFDKYFIKEKIPYPKKLLSLGRENSTTIKLLERIEIDQRENSEQIVYQLRKGDHDLLKTELKTLEERLQGEMNAQELLLFSLINEPQVEALDELIDQLQDLAKRKGGLLEELSLKTLLNRYIGIDETITYSENLVEAVGNWVELSLTLSCIKAALTETNPHLIGALMKRSTRDDCLIKRSADFFEMTSQKLLRKRQWKILKKTENHQRLVFQLSSGEGKTSVITRTLALSIIADGKNVLNVVPKANIEMDYENLREFFASHTVYKVQRLQFSRDSSREALESIYRSVEASKIKKALFVTDPSSLQAILLKYFEVLMTSKNNAERPLELQYLERIIDFIMNDSKSLVDEQHIVFNPLHYLNYASQEEQILSALHYEVTFKLYSFILEYNASHPEKPMPISKWYNCEFTKDDYHTFYKPALVKKIANHFSSLDPLNVECYLHANRSLINNQERFALQTWLDSLPENKRKELGLYKAQLDVYLPHTLGMRCLVNYGRIDGVETAVAFMGNMTPAPKSTFQNIEILLNTTIQAYYIQGLEQSHVRKLVHIWRQKELDRGFKSPLVELAAIPTLLDKDLNSDLFLNKILPVVSTNQACINEYLTAFVFPEIRVQTHRFASSIYDLSNLLLTNYVAFTATLLSNFLTLPQNVNIEFDGKVHTEMLELLYDPQMTQIITPPVLEFGSLLAIPNVCMVLDPHALLEGKRNKSVAESLLQASGALFGQCQYFDDSLNVLTTMCNSDALADKARTITYCDQIHTTGVDTVQPENGVGIILGNKGLTFTELLQTARRLRKFGNGQTVRIVIVDSLRAHICQTMGIKNLSNESLVLWTLLNESLHLEKITSLAFEQQMISIYRGGLLHKLLSTNNWEEKKTLVNAYVDLVAEEVNNEDFVEIASLEKSQSALEQFTTKFQRYHQEHGKLLDEKKELELANLKKMAEGYLSTAQEASSEKLNVTAQKEQQVYKETHDHLALKNSKIYGVSWNALFAVTSTELISNWAKEHFNTLYNEPQGSKIPVFLPTSLIFNYVSDKENIYFSHHFISIKHLPYYKNYLPKMDFVLSILGPRNKRKFLVISSEEANMMRPLAKSLQEAAEKALLDENGFLRMNLFTINGYHVTGTDKETAEIDLRILTIIQFLNGETKYIGKVERCLVDWLKEDHTEAKINDFVHRSKQRTVEYSRNLNGTCIQDIFETVKSSLSLNTTKSDRVSLPSSLPLPEKASSLPVALSLPISLPQQMATLQNR